MAGSLKQGRKKPGRSAKPKPHRIPQVLLVIETSHANGRAVIEGIAHYAQENGPWAIRFEPREFDSFLPKWLKEWNGDGIIARTVKKEQADMLRTAKLPLVELAGNPQYGVAQVQVDDAAMGRAAFEHLLDRGLRHFGHFSYGEPWWAEAHREGFRDVLAAHGYDCHIYRSSPCGGNIRSIWRESERPRVVRWLRSLPRPIGIYTIGDSHSARLLDICREMGVVVPEEVAILGMNNDVAICETVRPTLSSLDLDGRRVGYEAARLLDRLMAGERPPKDVILVPPKAVVVRQSTDLMVVEDADVAQAMQFIRDFACKGIGVDDVADAVGLSRSVLQRRFHGLLGRTPKAEIMRVQMERAKVLLAELDNTTESIAHKCGFSSVKYFSRAFRREVGMTTTAYRQKRKT